MCSLVGTFAKSARVRSRARLIWSVSILLPRTPHRSLVEPRNAEPGHLAAQGRSGRLSQEILVGRGIGSQAQVCVLSAAVQHNHHGERLACIAAGHVDLIGPTACSVRESPLLKSSPFPAQRPAPVAQFPCRPLCRESCPTWVSGREGTVSSARDLGVAAALTGRPGPPVSSLIGLLGSGPGSTRNRRGDHVDRWRRWQWTLNLRGRTRQYPGRGYPERC